MINGRKQNEVISFISGKHSVSNSYIKDLVQLQLKMFVLFHFFQFFYLKKSSLNNILNLINALVWPCNILLILHEFFRVTLVNIPPNEEDISN